jgi:hypothetical protein
MFASKHTGVRWLKGKEALAFPIITKQKHNTQQFPSVNFDFQHFCCIKVYTEHFDVSRYENITKNQWTLMNLPVTPWCKVFLNIMTAAQLIKPCCYGTLQSMLSHLHPLYLPKLYCIPGPCLT